MRKPDYASMFTLRADGRFMGYWREPSGPGQPRGKRHAIYDRDPERLYLRIQALENPEPVVVTFADVAASWEEKHWERIGAKTAETYTAPLARLLANFADVALADVSAQSIQAFLADLGKQGFSRRSVQMHRDILNMIFNDAILAGRASFNPVSAVSLPRGLPVKKRELPSDEAVAAVKAGADLPFGLFALVCLYSGLRRGEVLALRFKDVDRERRLIHVSQAVEFIGNNPHLKSPKTAAGVRSVPLLDPLADALPASGSGFIFAREDGGLLTKTQYRKRWLRYCEALGFEITAHQLRHGYATLLFEAGISDKDAQELLGHSSIAVTRDVYTHIRSCRREETADRLGAFLLAQKEKRERLELLTRLVSILRFVVIPVVKDAGSPENP